jgi:hypothetical protein
MALCLEIRHLQGARMVRRHPPKELSLQMSGFAGRTGNFYRSCTAVERASRSTPQQSGLSFAIGLSARSGSDSSDPWGGAARSRTTCICGPLANLVQAPAQADERERSGGSTRRVRSHGAPLHRHGQAHFAAPSGRALSHRGGRDRRVLADARAADCCAPSRSDRLAPGTGSRRASSGAASRERTTRVRPLRQAPGGVASATRRLEASLMFGGVR